MAKVRMLALGSRQGVRGTYSGLVVPDLDGYVVIDARDFPTFSNSDFTPVAAVSYLTDPNTSNDSTQGYYVGFLWINTNIVRIWLCTSATENTATWILLYQHDK